MISRNFLTLDLPWEAISALRSDPDTLSLLLTRKSLDEATWFKAWDMTESDIVRSSLIYRELSERQQLRIIESDVNEEVIFSLHATKPLIPQMVDFILEKAKDSHTLSEDVIEWSAIPVRARQALLTKISTHSFTTFLCDLSNSKEHSTEEVFEYLRALGPSLEDALYGPTSRYVIIRNRPDLIPLIVEDPCLFYIFSSVLVRSELAAQVDFSKMYKTLSDFGIVNIVGEIKNQILWNPFLSNETLAFIFDNLPARVVMATPTNYKQTLAERVPIKHLNELPESQLQQYFDMHPEVQGMLYGRKSVFLSLEKIPYPILRELLRQTGSRADTLKECERRNIELPPAFRPKRDEAHVHKRCPSPEDLPLNYYCRCAAKHLLENFQGEDSAAWASLFLLMKSSEDDVSPRQLLKGLEALSS